MGAFKGYWCARAKTNVEFGGISAVTMSSNEDTGEASSAAALRFVGLSCLGHNGTVAAVINGMLQHIPLHCSALAELCACAQVSV